jgi:hypothetical protein
MYSGSSGPRSTSTVPCVGTAGSDAEAEITISTVIQIHLILHVTCLFIGLKICEISHPRKRNLLR